MAKFRKPAVKIMQGKRTLFLTSFTIRDFITENFYRVNRLDVIEGTGQQRLLDITRAMSFGRDVIDANNHGAAFLPTTVLLATSGKIDYDETAQEISFDSSKESKICPLDMVDGQHRIEGLKFAIYGEFLPPEAEGGQQIGQRAPQHEALLDFPVSVVIADGMTTLEKKLQFLVVNTKQVKVKESVNQSMISHFTKMLQVEKLPYLPPWLRKEVERGDILDASAFVLGLAQDSKSPWRGRVHLADAKGTKPRHMVDQAAFVKSVKKHLLAANHPLQYALKSDKQLPVLINFWVAVDKVFVAPSEHFDARAESVVFGTNGLEFFHSISSAVFARLVRADQYTVDAFEQCLRSAEPHLRGDAAILMSPEYWKKGGEVGSLNTGGIMKRFAAPFAKAVANASDNDAQV